MLKKQDIGFRTNALNASPTSSTTHLTVRWKSRVSIVAVAPSESYLQHQEELSDPSGSFFLCKGAVRADLRLYQLIICLIWLVLFVK